MNDGSDDEFQMDVENSNDDDDDDDDDDDEEIVNTVYLRREIKMMQERRKSLDEINNVDNLEKRTEWVARSAAKG